MLLLLKRRLQVSQRKIFPRPSGGHVVGVLIVLDFKELPSISMGSKKRRVLFLYFFKGFIVIIFHCLLSSLRAVTLNKRLNIQRRLAWSLCKDDTHNRREAKPFFSTIGRWGCGQIITNERDTLVQLLCRLVSYGVFTVPWFESCVCKIFFVFNITNHGCR